jgi:pyrroline-5-carboxylate reductase
MFKFESKIGFIGGGVMARAIIEGLIKSKFCSSNSIYVSHPNETQKFTDLNIALETNDNEAIVTSCDIILFCTKPQQIEFVIKSLHHLIVPHKHLIISICAGVSLSKLDRILRERYFTSPEAFPELSFKMVRCTMNTAATIGESCSVFSRTEAVSQEEVNIVKDILSSIGICYGEFNDNDLDTVTNLVGSGIAYMYMMVDSMADGACKMGLPKRLALQMATQTMLGASRLMQTSNRSPSDLKDDVCSPGGTTIHGIHELEKGGFRASIISAIESGVKRAREFN